MTIGSYYYNPVTNDLSYEPLVILNLVTQISPLRKLARIIPNFWHKLHAFSTNNLYAEYMSVDGIAILCIVDGIAIFKVVML